MLVLSRKRGEKIYIRTPDGQYITVHISSLDKNAVKLGFEAPSEYVIAREEIMKDVVDPMAGD